VHQPGAFAREAFSVGNVLVALKLAGALALWACANVADHFGAFGDAELFGSLEEGFVFSFQRAAAAIVVDHELPVLPGAGAVEPDWGLGISVCPLRPFDLDFRVGHRQPNGFVLVVEGANLHAVARQRSERELADLCGGAELQDFDGIGFGGFGVFHRDLELGLFVVKYAN
jgi:hypothetical protein